MILVTGGAGFIGSNFVLEWLGAEGTPVVNLDKLTYAGNLENLSSLQGDARHVFVQGGAMFSDRLRQVLDMQLIAELILSGARITGVPRVGYQYRRHEDNQTAALTRNLKRFVLKIHSKRVIAVSMRIEQGRAVLAQGARDGQQSGRHGALPQTRFLQPRRFSIFSRTWACWAGVRLS